MEFLMRLPCGRVHLREWSRPFAWMVAIKQQEVLVENMRRIGSFYLIYGSFLSESEGIDIGILRL